MQYEITQADRDLLDRLLKKLAGCMDGAIDFWPLVCLAGAVPDRRGFLLEQCELMRSLVIVTRTFLAEFHLAYAEPIPGQLKALMTACQNLQEAFLSLEQFRTVPLEEVRAATESVAVIYSELRETILQLGQALGLPNSYWQGRRAEWEEYFQNILRGLFGQFRQERESPQYLAAVPSATV